MTHDVSCPECGVAHDIEALEPSFKRPDAYLVAKSHYTDCEVRESKDACAFCTNQEPEGRYYLRVLLPFVVQGLSTPCSWGVWVEVSPADFERTDRLWSDPEQSREPPFPGTLANAMHSYEDTVGLEGLVQLSGPSKIPTFTLNDDQDHVLVGEQAAGVSQARVMEWLIPIYHPKVAGKSAG